MGQHAQPGMPGSIQRDFPSRCGLIAHPGWGLTCAQRTKRPGRSPGSSLNEPWLQCGPSGAS